MDTTQGIDHGTRARHESNAYNIFILVITPLTGVMVLLLLPVDEATRGTDRSGTRSCASCSWPTSPAT